MLQLGMSFLVKQLKQTDINGAPLLFLAVHTETERSCFEEVRAEIVAVLSRVGFNTQLMSMDSRKKGIAMYAAMGQHLETFKQVKELIDVQCSWVVDDKGDVDDEVNDEANTRPTPEHDQAKEETEEVRQMWTRLLEWRDDVGRTLLHYASGEGSVQVLREVVKMGTKYDVLETMSAADGNGRTPVMYVLRNMFNRDRGVLELKLGLLADSARDPTGLKGRCKVLSPPGVDLTRNHTVANTVLMHAARGGPEAFDIALNNIWAWDKKSWNLDHALDIELVQGVGEKSVSNHAEAEGPIDMKTWGRGMLLAAAARGGHLEILDIVTAAIRVSGVCVSCRSLFDYLIFFVLAMREKQGAHQMVATVNHVTFRRRKRQQRSS